MRKRVPKLGVHAFMLVGIPALMLCGCLKKHSSGYIPKASDKAHLVIVDNEHAVFKNRIRRTLRDDGMVSFANCDTKAADAAATARNSYSAGKGLTTAAGFIYLIGIAPGIIMASVGSDLMRDSQAELIDAINVHNDSASCISAKVADKKPTQAKEILQPKPESAPPASLPSTKEPESESNEGMEETKGEEGSFSSENASSTNGPVSDTESIPEEDSPSAGAPKPEASPPSAEAPKPEAESQTEPEVIQQSEK